MLVPNVSLEQICSSATTVIWKGHKSEYPLCIILGIPLLYKAIRGQQCISNP